jgi:SPP1 gp7 family putative phage head morphogenesis protein
LGCTSLPHSANSLTEGQILFLKKCHNHPKSQPIGGYISKVASNNETSLIERFVDLGLLSGATLAEKLEDMPVAELKALFHKLGLVPKKNARKQLLIDSLLTSCDNATLSDQVQHLGRYHLTNLGHRVVQQYRDCKEAEKTKIAEMCIDLICCGKIDEAYRCICKQNLNSPYPVGLGVNWAYELSHGYPQANLPFLYELLAKKRATPPDFDGDNLRFNATSIYYILSGDEYSHGKDSNNLFRADLFLFSNQRQLHSYASTGVKRYRFTAALDLSTCPTCASLDGKIFRTSKAKIGLNFPPLHPNCRCTTMPDMSEQVIAKIKRAARDPATGKSITVPGNTTYAEWRRTFVESNPDVLAREAYEHSNEYKQRQLKWDAESRRIRQKEDEFYVTAESRILSIVRDNPGILQKDLTVMFGNDLRNAAAFTLNRLFKRGYINKVRNGRTFSLYIVAGQDDTREIKD